MDEAREVGHHQHPAPENQDSEHMIDQPRGSFFEMVSGGVWFGSSPQDGLLQRIRGRPIAPCESFWGVFVAVGCDQVTTPDLFIYLYVFRPTFWFFLGLSYLYCGHLHGVLGLNPQDLCLGVRPV